MDALDGNTITTIIAILAVSLGLYYFQSKQLAAAEKRLRGEISDIRGEISDIRGEITASETRLRDEIKASENRLRGEIEAAETRLRDEIRAVDIRLDKSVEATNRRIDETNVEIRILINDVGVIKGALGVSTQSREREPVSAE